MLTHLHIEHFVLLDDIDIDFKKGMNVILGETGAGKSILMNALSLLSGTRSEFDRIRLGEEKAFIEGVFKIENKDVLKEFKDAYEDYLDDDTFVLSRTLDIKGKSTSRFNGRVVPLTLMKEIMSKVLDIHSSSRELVFFDEKKQLSILDSFIKTNEEFTPLEEDIYTRYNEEYNQYVSICKKIEYFNNILNDNQDMDYIAYQLNELKNANLKENELENLEDELIALQNIVYLSEKMEKFSVMHENASSSLYEAKKVLENFKDDVFEKQKEAYLDAYYNLIEAYDALESEFKETLDKSSRVEEIRSRVYYLRSLKRKYGSSTSEMIEKMCELEKIIEDKENAEYELKKLNTLLSNQIEVLKFEDNKLSVLRKKYASKLENSINKELKDLLFNSADFKVEFYEDNINKAGMHNIKFKLKANEGMDYLSLSDTASLGESSRLSLALKKVFFDYSYKETLIFDEIDVGISGKAALSVGKKIYELAKKTQVMCISHLGQVAIQGDHHYLIKKVVENNTTTSNIKELSSDEAINEIAKMVSGGSVDKASIELVKSWK